MTKKRSPGEGLGRTWRWNLDSGSHNLGHIWSYKALLSLLVTIGLRKSTGSETSSELFCFRKKKIVKPPHRMETLGRRCKPLGSVSSVSAVLVSRTKKEKGVSLWNQSQGGCDHSPCEHLVSVGRREQRPWSQSACPSPTMMDLALL